jgi:hypothetical protein
MRLLLLGLCICAVQAHAFPISGKAVRIVVPFPPGGQTDIQARAIAQRMVEASSLAVIVEASGMPPSEMAQAARSLHERWAAVIRDTGVKLD